MGLLAAFWELFVVGLQMGAYLIGGYFLMLLLWKD